MFKAVSKGTIVALVFIAFIGQTMALIMTTPCDNSLDAHHSAVTERIAPTDLTSIDTELVTPCCDVECCDLDCICIANACSSIIYLPTFYNLTSADFATLLIFRQTTEQTISFASLLYRPPIFA
ncbi:hypothetical protein [Paraglaciecola sp. L3A3]|uniref:hypothetical protein n=1 Tax=Paraglaciecola sp. L3A3 TaxID=2686358 RepID=UPI00131BF50C|nr:hypothetical protein [Paraglaciecola sp. L3A3]